MIPRLLRRSRRCLRSRLARQSLKAAIAAVSWPSVTGLLQGESMAQRSREYVQTCFAVGVSDWQIIFVHVLPNTLSSVVKE